MRKNAKKADGKHLSPPVVVAVNVGSSSLRFAVFEGGRPKAIITGGVNRTGLARSRFETMDSHGHSLGASSISASTTSEVVAFFVSWLERQSFFPRIQGVGHRVVHGGEHREPQRVTTALVVALKKLRAVDPEHLPGEIAAMQAVRRRFPRLPQVACFDTAFHHTLPKVARLLTIPRSFADQGLVRYGFHGISYEYLIGKLSEQGDPAAKKGRVILAHLGHGASLAAVLDGNSVDTSMGFTPAAGIMMGTRAGDLDPGVLSYLARTEAMTPKRLERMVNHECGLLGVSGTSSDMRELCAREAKDPRAAEAVSLFCYQVKKWIGAYTAVLGGLDTLVFSGGIGENAPAIRARICDGLEFLGVRIKPHHNVRNAAVISRRKSAVSIRVIPTNEELIIARAVARLLGVGGFSSV